jgi:hypothetical protein
MHPERARARAWQSGTSMAEINVQRTTTHHTEVVEDDYENWEIALWLLGILAIPGVPILMVVLLTPWSGL